VAVRLSRFELLRAIVPSPFRHAAQRLAIAEILLIECRVETGSAVSEPFQIVHCCAENVAA
jgi:hypothetical protein